MVNTCIVCYSNSPVKGKLSSSKLNKSLIIISSVPFCLAHSLCDESSHVLNRHAILPSRIGEPFYLFIIFLEQYSSFWEIQTTQKTASAPDYIYAFRCVEKREGLWKKNGGCCAQTLFRRSSNPFCAICCSIWDLRVSTS